MSGDGLISQMETYTSYLGWLILGLWLLASVINQFRFRWWSSVARFDVFSLVPRWTFFAPNPGRHDYHVVYREWTAESSGEWSEVPAPEIDLKLRWFWNPHRYPSKGISDVTAALASNVRRSYDIPVAVTLSAPYISLLHLVMAQPSAGESGDRRQFAIVRTNGFGCERDLDIAFLSEVHRK